MYAREEFTPWGASWLQYDSALSRQWWEGQYDSTWSKQWWEGQYDSTWSQQWWKVRAEGDGGWRSSDESFDENHLPSERDIEQWKKLRQGKDWKKWEEVLSRIARKAFDWKKWEDEEREDWYEWKERNEDCLKLNEEWAVHRMLCLLKETIKPVPERLDLALCAAEKETEEAEGALQRKCDYVQQQLRQVISIFGTGDSYHKTVRDSHIEELVNVIVLVQDVVEVCQKQGSQFLIEITERDQGPLHGALKALRDVFTLRLSLTVKLGDSTAWEEAAKKAYVHYPGVLGDASDEERSKLLQSYVKVMWDNDNFCKLGFLFFDSNATKTAKGKKRPKKRPKSGSEPLDRAER